jgi:diguanylate cyclase (GGDEF)-like protein/PAS domain S-box-containing protein
MHGQRDQNQHDRCNGLDEDVLCQVLAAVQEAVVVLDLDGTVTRWSDGAEAMYGWSEAEAVGTHIDDLVVAVGLIEVDSAEVLGEASVGRTWEDSLVVRGKQAELPVRVATTPLRDHDGTVVGAIGVSADLTLRRETEEALAKSEAAFLRVFDESPVSNAIIAPDARLQLTRVNPAFASMLGYEPHELVGRSLIEISHPGDLERELEYGLQLMEGKIPFYRIDKRMLHKDGSTVRCRATGSLVRDEQGVPLYGIGMIENITDLSAARDTIARQKDRLDLTLEAAAMSTWEVDLATGKLSASHNAADVYGFGEGQPTPTSVDELLSFVHPDDLHVFDLEPPDKPGVHDRFTVDFRVAIPGRGIAWMRQVGAYIRDADGQVTAIRGTTVDATERRAQERALAEQAVTDELTGLPNRALFLERLAAGLERLPDGDGSMLAVLFIDIDRFRLINDSLGHSAGDELLIQVGERVRAAVRRDATVARIGGDEFVVLCEGLEHTGEAVEVARRLSYVLEEPITAGGRDCYVTLSVGIAPVADSGADPECILRDADAAMYRAKEKGGGRYELFDERLQAEAMARIELEDDLRRGIAAGAIVAHFQPVVTLDGRVTGFEALARWWHAERGLVAPAEFIPVAEETGLISAIGRTMLQQACTQLSLWRETWADASDCTVAVNLSSRQLTDAGLVDEVRAALVSSGLEPSALRFELTETALMADTPEVNAAVMGLRELGVRLSVDDFGTGYSSLLYLRRFPVDVVKLDRLFVAGLGTNDVDEAIVGSMIGLAHTLGMEAVAEGVETIDQLEVLRRLGCDQAQGFYWSAAQPADQIEGQILHGLVRGTAPAAGKGRLLRRAVA